jgi:hypothetical protein
MRKLKRQPTACGRPARAGVIVPDGTLFNTGVAARIKESLCKDFNLHTVVRLPFGVFEPYTPIRSNILFFDASGPTTETWYYEVAIPDGRKKYSKTKPLRTEDLQGVATWWADRTESDSAWRVPISDFIAAGYNIDFPQSESAGRESPGGSDRCDGHDQGKSRFDCRGNECDREDPGKNVMTSMRPIGELLVEENRLIDVLDDVEYACGGVRLHGQGLFVREYKLGVDLRKKFVQHVVKEGDVVYSTLFAKAGAFAVAGADMEGVVLSEKFPTFRLVSNDISLPYLTWFFRSGQLNRIAEQQMTGIAAFSLSHLSKRKFLRLRIPVPSADRQTEVVSLCAAAHVATARAIPSAIRNAKVAEHLVGSAAAKACASLPRIRIANIGDYVLRPVDIRPDERFTQITVAMKNRGLRVRRVCDGSDIKSPGQCLVREGDILFSRIDIWQGAIGIVGKELDGGVVTRDFPVYRLHEDDAVTRQFMRYVFMTPEFAAQAREVSRGTTGRKKMKRPAFLQLLVPWCDPERRLEIVGALDEIESRSVPMSDRFRKQAVFARQIGGSVVSTLFAKDSGLM